MTVRSHRCMEGEPICALLVTIRIAPCHSSCSAAFQPYSASGTCIVLKRKRENFIFTALEFLLASVLRFRCCPTGTTAFERVHFQSAPAAPTPVFSRRAVKLAEFFMLKARPVSGNGSRLVLGDALRRWPHALVARFAARAASRACWAASI